MKTPLIINCPDLQTLKQKYTYAAITLLFWVIWFYLWLPLLSFFAWVFGIEIFYEHMVVLDGLNSLVDMLGWYALIITLTGVILILWSRYNLLRFRKKNQRTQPAPLTPQQLSLFFKIEAKKIEHYQVSRRIIIQHDADGNIKTISTDNENNPG